VGLLEQAINRFSDNLQAKAEQIIDSPSAWIEKYFWVPDPRDPYTGERLPAGPMVLATHQRRIIDEALRRLPNGKLKYSTVIYSAPKKSGKSAIASAVTLYFAHHNPESHLYCVANDGRQSEGRIFAPILTNFRLHRDKSGIFKSINPNKKDVTLPNNTTIEAITCDAAGEAGSQPLLVAYSEIWGYDTDNKKRLWTEMTIPPTLEGYAMRWVETYAGFTGKSELLEQLYNTAVKEGTPHPDFLDMMSDGLPVVYVNEAAGIFCYWDHEPRMVWQSSSYYSQESKLLTPSEYRRIHENRWVSPIDAFISEEMWMALKKEAPPLTNKTPIVLGVDGAISNDYAAIVGVTRDPDDNEDILVRFCYIFTPQKGGGTIKISETVEPKIRELCNTYYIVCVAYDKYQLEDMAQRLRKDKVCWMFNFSQQNDRSVADKGLYDRVTNKQIFWDMNGFGLNKMEGVPTLYQHVTQAGSKNDGGKLRLEKLTDNAKIDAAVALSMATAQCKKLNLSNREGSLLERLKAGRLTEDEILTKWKEQNDPVRHT
jgi:phage terminase large subunit-like protein